MVRTIAFSVVGVLAAALVGVFLFRNRPRRQEAVYYYQCTKCNRRLKYRARQVNGKGMCPACKQRFIFPAITKA
jgi:hypothetical protein